MNNHYIKIDTDKNIIKGFSDAFEQPLINDICINEDGERHFELNGIINPSLINSQGIYLYKYVNGEVVTKNDDEIQQEISELPVVVQEPTIADLQAQIFSLTTQLINGGAL